MENKDDFSHKITSLEEGIIEYFDKRGVNVTPLPLATPGEVEDQDEEREKVGRKLKLPPRKNTIMKTLLHVTTALYSMAGLGSLEQSRAFKEISKQTLSSIGDTDHDESGSGQESHSKELKEINLDSTGDLSDTLRTVAHGYLGPPLSPQLRAHLPDQMLAKTAKEIEVLLVETDTIWMLELQGTCEEFDPDDPKEESAQGQKHKLKEQNPSMFERVESWTQTLDFSRKRKGTQCDELQTGQNGCQVSTKDFLTNSQDATLDIGRKISGRKVGSPRL